MRISAGYGVQNVLRESQGSQGSLAVAKVSKSLLEHGVMTRDQILELIDQAARDHREILDLSGENIEELPPEIGNLANLTELSLSQNQLTTVPKELGNLTNLTELYLSHNQLITVPKELGNLANLTELSLSQNQLTTVPKELGNLANLTRLSLSQNQLITVPKELGNLVNLTEFYLSHNQLTTVPKELGNLANLTRLDLYQNQLITVPEDLGNLANLARLDLSQNQLITVPKELGNLANLTRLDLYQNQLITVPKELGNLTNLTMLSLSQNQLTTVPKELRNLANLTLLSLDQNQLTIVPKELGDLVNLTRLSLYQNQLTTVPKELGNLANLTWLDLDQNPALTAPPPEIVTQGTTAILTYLQDQLKDGEPQWISKLLVVGEGGVGKTSLLRALRGEPFKEQLSTTHGIEIKTLNLEHPTQADVTMTLNTWDFGGQEIYHATHQFFLTNRSLFLLVWNARFGYEQGKLIYWLKTIRANAPDSPILLVATWTDERDADLPLADLQKQFPQIKDLYSVSNKSNDGIHKLKDAIRDTAAQLPLMGEIWPKSWLQLATEIRQTPERCTTPQAFFQTMTRHQVRAISQPVLARFLHELGDILFFQTNANLNELVILKPQWVTQYISQVLTAQAVINANGIFTRSCMDRLWSDLDPSLREHFLELMEEFDLSYQIPEDPFNKSLVVERLSHNPSEYRPLWDRFTNQKRIIMNFQISEILAGIPTWFIARQHRFTLNHHWRTGVLFGDDRQDPKHLGLLKVEQDVRTNANLIRLEVRGPMPHSFFDILREGLELTLRRYPGLEITRLLPCPDPLNQGCRHEFNFSNLTKRLERNPPKETIDCEECLETISVTQLLFGLHYTTQKDVIDRLDHLNATFKDGFHELRELIQREFLRAYRRDQNLPESWCPNLFTLQPDNRKFWDRDLGSSRLNLQLYCQYPGEVHPVCDPTNPPRQKDPSQGFYPIDTPTQWLQNIAPYVTRMVGILKYAAPVSPLLGYTIPNLSEFIEADVSLMTALVDKLPSLELEDNDSHHHFKDPDHLSGSALRALREFLKKEDPDECWGHLNRVITPEGDILWVCEKHERILFPT